MMRYPNNLSVIFKIYIYTKVESLRTKKLEHNILEKSGWITTVYWIIYYVVLSKNYGP
jgi:hypothetical protein